MNLGVANKLNMHLLTEIPLICQVILHDPLIEFDLNSANKTHLCSHLQLR